MAAYLNSTKLGEQFLESWMTDICVITRDPEQNFDDVLNVTTGLLDPVNPVDTRVIYRGKCLLKRPNSAEGEQGGQVVADNTRRIMIPKSVRGVKVEDRVQIHASRDEEFVGLKMKITGIQSSSYSTYRMLSVEDIVFGR